MDDSPKNVNPDRTQAMRAAARAAAEVWLMLEQGKDQREYVFEGDDILRLWNGAKIFVTIRCERAK